VNIPADSARLRALQLNVTKLVAQGSGQAISGAIDGAIADGFSDGGAFITPGPNGFHVNFAADPDDGADPTHAASKPGQTANAYGLDDRGPGGPARTARGGSRIDDAFAAIDQQMPRKALPRTFREEKGWLLWVDVRGSGIDRWGSTTTPANTQISETSLHGTQVNALLGLTYKAAPNFLIGAVGG
jgi:hypothetical protein